MIVKIVRLVKLCLHVACLCAIHVCHFRLCARIVDSVVTVPETGVDFTVGVGLSVWCVVRSENFRVSVGGSSGVRV